MEKLNVHRTRPILFLLLFLLLFGVFAVPVSASSTSGGGASEAEGIGTSFYDVSTALTAYANSVVGSNTNDKHADHRLSEMNGQSPGVAGAFVGYGDTDRGFYAFISSNTAHAVTTSSYDAWSNVGDGGATYAYVRYGYLLNDLGLDDAASEGGIFGRTVFGWFMRAVHAIAGLIPQLFGLCLSLLRLLNPFTLLTSSAVNSYKVVSNPDGSFSNIATGTGTNVGDMLGTSVSDTGVLGDIAAVVSEIYNRLQAMGIYVIVPLLLGIMLFSILMHWGPGASPWRKVLVFLERFAFIVIGVPICAMLYTSAINQAYDIVMDEPAASQLVASTFVDFQGWVTNGRLGLPPGVTLVSSGLDSDTGDASTTAGAASSDTVRALRHNVFEINRGTGVVPVDALNPISSSSEDAGGDLNDGYYFANMWDTNGFVSNLVDDDTTSRRVGSLLSRYSSGDRYQASAWETAVNGTMNEKYPTELGATPSTANATSNDGMIYGMYDYTDDSSDWLDREVADNDAIFSGVSYANGGDWSGKQWNVFSNGSLNASVTTDVNADITYSGGWNGSRQDGSDPSEQGGSKLGGLSSVAMYNYLSTDFTDSSVSVYSSVRSTSEYVKPSHFSANLIGSGVLQFLYGANCVAVLGIFVIIGLFYGLGMVISNLKRGVHLLLQIPGAMLGILKSIVQIIVYTIVMIMELLGTIFMYVVFTDLIIMFATMIEKPIHVAVTSSIVIGGRTAFVGAADPSSLYNSTAVFVFGMAVVVLALLLLGRQVVKCRRVVLVVWEVCWCKMFRLVTCKALRPAFDAWMRNRVSLYVWDLSMVPLKEVWKSLWTTWEGVEA